MDKEPRNAHPDHSRHGTDGQATSDESIAYAMQFHERLKSRSIETKALHDVQL